MHFSIPDTQEFTDGSSNTYIGYNIHINGFFHCTVRYKQLHNLHEQLMRHFETSLPQFPPKKLFPLTVNQQEERRLSLEKYIQSIGQNVIVNSSELLNGFFLNAQQETTNVLFENEELNVFLQNGYRITICVCSGENSTEVLKKVCNRIKLPEKYHSYFTLFIVAQEDDIIISILRKLQDFESPYITYQNMHSACTQITLGRNYWDIGYDLDLLNDTVALNLLYVQAISEISRGWIFITDELQDRLITLSQPGLKRKYMDLVRTLKFYGYVQFIPCFCDYPEANTKILVAIGRNELNLRILSANSEQYEAVFKVSRMRCWRVTTLQNDPEKCEGSNNYSLELSFEYLIARNELRWITISSEQAILMSVCLQSMIDELLSKNQTTDKSQSTSQRPWTYIMRDGQSQITMGPSMDQNVTKVQKDINNDASTKSEPILKKIVNRLSAVTLKKSNNINSSKQLIKRQCTTQTDVMENKAFHMIGDEDL